VLQEGLSFGPYRVRHRLGAGAMGEVYLAFDARLQRDVALKVLSAKGDDHDAASQRLIGEARLASTLSHPNICTVFEAGEIDGRPFIAMERVDGDPLSAIIQRKTLSTERVLRIGALIADGLAHAHAHGVVHRDLKSSNVLVAPNGSVKILDFGLATRVVESGEPTEVATRPARETMMCGTVPYMAPEVLRGAAADPRSDLWALGVMLFEMVARRRPFGGRTSYELTSAILTESVPDLPLGTAPGLAAIVRRCLEKEPGERYQTALEVKAALDAVGSIGHHAAGSAARRRLAYAVAALAVLPVALATALVWQRRATSMKQTGRAAIHTIAVLPLANLSGDAGQDFFADGMTEALITDLARVRGLDVISRTSVTLYKNTTKRLPEVARELSADAVVEGSVLRAGDRVRITAQLIEAATDRHLWADEYDRDVRDILTLQHDVARTIAHQIRDTLTPQEEAGLTGGRPLNPAAHDLYLRGRAFTLRYNEPSIAEAIRLLEEAIRIDPEYADAWVGLASAHSERGIWGVARSRETGARAHEAIAHALALDSGNPWAYAVLGNISMVYDWDWTAAERALTRSIAMAPGESRAHGYYSALLQTTRRFSEAVDEAATSRRLDPASPLAVSNFARACYRARRFDEAIAAFHDSIALDPSYRPNYARIADV
jgi:TolB-like protein/Tfp pilus assembly protein PilF